MEFEVSCEDHTLNKCSKDADEPVCARPPMAQSKCLEMAILPSTNPYKPLATSSVSCSLSLTSNGAMLTFKALITTGEL